MKPREHSPGLVRYLTYYLHFPKDKDYWVDQIPFCQDLLNLLKNTKFPPKLAAELLRKGEGHWKDHNGVTHRVTIEETWQPRKWGTKKV